MECTDLNERLIRDIIRDARMDPESLRFKYYAREMRYVLETRLLSDAVRVALTAGIRAEEAKGHR